ncbi:hypothetical protein [Rhizobium sp. CAU 1783]
MRRHPRSLLHRFTAVLLIFLGMLTASGDALGQAPTQIVAVGPLSLRVPADWTRRDGPADDNPHYDEPAPSPRLGATVAIAVEDTSSGGSEESGGAQKLAPRNYSGHRASVEQWLWDEDGVQGITLTFADVIPGKVVKVIGWMPQADWKARKQLIWDIFASIEIGDGEADDRLQSDVPALGPPQRFELGNIDAVANGPRVPTMINIARPIQLLRLRTYHWNNGHGKQPGTISLINEQGERLGPWKAIGEPGQGGVPNAYWLAEINTPIPTGSYRLRTSSDKTWSTNEGVGWQGFFSVEWQDFTSEDVSGTNDASPGPEASEDLVPDEMPSVALDSWRAPREQVLFDGTESKLFIPHQAHGGVFDQQATYKDGALVVDVPANSGWGKVGLLSSDPLVWLDQFHDDAEVRVDFTLDPARTSGFGFALAEPGWGGVAGNEPGNPDARFYWIRQPDGASVRSEFHVDPHGENDFWKDVLKPDAPEKVSFVLKPGKISVVIDDKVLVERPWSLLASGTGFRVYAFSHAADINLPTQLALRSITVTRHYPERPEPEGPPAGIEPLPVTTIFDGKPTPLFEPAATGGGNFDSFASYADGALTIDVPPGNSWGKTGLLSAEPLVILDPRARETPVRLGLTVDPKATRTFVIALQSDKVVEMWPGHQAWLVLSRRDDLGSYLLQVHGSVYNDRVRSFPIAWFDQHWDGRLDIDIADRHVCLRIPDGPVLCSEMPVGVGYQLYGTILAHAPSEGEGTALFIRKITRGLATPANMNAERRWYLVDDEAFDPDQFMTELGALAE